MRKRKAKAKHSQQKKQKKQKSCLVQSAGTLRHDPGDLSRDEPPTYQNFTYKAREQFVKAEGLVEATGYHRRDRDIGELGGSFSGV